jgi:pyruvate formate lyase activating enzyme
MLIKGLAKLTLLDYPEHVACTVFTGGCNFRCPFCHNASLVERVSTLPTMDESDIFSFLAKRRGVLDGVCVTGGEPLMMPDLGDFLGRIKDMGYAVKLDTNGSYPDRLAALIDRGLVDMVAMDIKNSPEKYALTTGLSHFDMAPIYQSVDILMQGSLPYEFRTTVVKELHSAEDFEKIGQWIRGAKAYHLQSFADSGDLLSQGLHAHTKESLTEFLYIVQKYVKASYLRGI